MPINTLEYSKLLMSKLDQQIIQGSTSGWMEENAGQVIYHGGNEVKIPTLSTQGLANYDRDKGFTQGGVTLSYETYKMLMDRGRTFQLDSMDIDETNFVVNASSVMKVFQEEHVIPEIDAYRYSAIATEAEEAGQSEDYTLSEDTVISKFREHVRAVQDVIGEEVPLVVSITSKALQAIEESPKLNRYLNTGEFKQGELSFKVKMIDDIPLRVVPSARMATKFKFQTGEGGQEEGGFKKDETAKDIHWIICARKAPLAISKTDKIRIFTPDINQKADAWKLDYRKYHGLWVKKSALKTIMVATNSSEA